MKFNFSIQTLAKSITIIFIISSSKRDSSNWNNISNFMQLTVGDQGPLDCPCPCPLIGLPQNDWPH